MDLSLPPFARNGTRASAALRCCAKSNLALLLFPGDGRVRCEEHRVLELGDGVRGAAVPPGGRAAPGRAVHQPVRSDQVHPGADPHRRAEGGQGEWARKRNVAHIHTHTHTHAHT